MKTYFCLVTRFDAADHWHLEFGDYEIETVLAEREDYAPHCYQTDVIACADNQAAINEQLDRLNTALNI